MLLAICLVLCSAIIREIFRKQRVELVLALHLFYTCVYNGMVCKFFSLRDTVGVVYGKNVIFMNYTHCEVE